MKMRMSTLTRHFVKEAVSKYVNHLIYVNKWSVGTEKYRKTTFEWESPKGKKFNQSGIRNRNYHDEEKNKFSKQKFTYTNTNQSLTTQMNRVKSIEAYLKLYNEHKQFFSLRLMAFGSRLLCILIQRERNNLFEANKEKQKNRLSESTKKNLKEYLTEVFQLYPKLKMEGAQKQQLKNFLFVAKKVFNQFEQILDLKQDSQNFDSQFSRKAARFRDQLLSIFSQPEFKMNEYEINGVVQIFYNLIKFSPENELSSIYHSILERKQQIADNINPQFLFSTTNFFLTIRTIEQNESKVQRNIQRSAKDQNNDERNEVRQAQDQIRTLSPIMQLREQCYRLFFNKWLYYYEDMKELIKLNDVKGVWYLILTSDSGIKLLLQNQNGPRAIDIVSLILSHHKSSIQQISQNQWRVFSNIAALLFFLDKKHPSNERILQLKESFVKTTKNTQIIEKGRMKLKMKTLVQKLHNQRLINSADRTDGLAFINQI